MKTFLLFLFLTAFLYETALPQENMNSSYEVGDDRILIHYDFSGNDVNDYEIIMVVRRVSKPDFEYKPADLKGDVGKGRFANKKNTITWILSEKEIELVSGGDDFYFQVLANEVQKSSFAWLYYVGGAVLVGGGVAAYLLLKPEEAGLSVLPQPPGRPTP